MISDSKKDPIICHLLEDTLDLCYRRTGWLDLPDTHPKDQPWPAALQTVTGDGYCRLEGGAQGYTECVLSMGCCSHSITAVSVRSPCNIIFTATFPSLWAGLVVLFSESVRFAASCLSVFLPANGSVNLIWLTEKRKINNQLSIFRALPNVDRSFWLNRYKNYVSCCTQDTLQPALLWIFQPSIYIWQQVEKWKLQLVKYYRNLAVLLHKVLLQKSLSS